LVAILEILADDCIRRAGATIVLVGILEVQLTACAGNGVSTCGARRRGRAARAVTGNRTGPPAGCGSHQARARAAKSAAANSAAAKDPEYSALRLTPAADGPA
jgi:hypothetical protein